MGYDVWKPGDVREQYKIEKGGGAHVDYALMKPESATPYLLIEAKPLGGDIFAQVEQIIDYCNYSKGARFGVITNGERWLILDEHWKERAARERKIYDFTLNQKIGEHRGYHILLLLHPENEKVWSPLVDKIRKLWETGVEEAIEAVIDKALEKIGIPTGEQKPSVPKDSEEDGIPMGKWPKDLNRKKPPNYVLIKDEKSEPIRSWADLVVIVAKWLVEQGKIKGPMKLGSGKLMIINDKPEQPSTKIKKPKPHIKALPNGLFVWTHGSANSLRDRCYKLLEHCGYSPDIIKFPADWKP